MKYDKNRKFKGIWIPKHIWFDEQLSIMEKLFFIEIDYLCNDDKRGCYASNKYFSEFFGVSTVRCSQIIKQLKSYKLIKIDYTYEGKEIKERNVFLTGIGIKFSLGGIKEILKKDNDINNDINIIKETSEKEVSKNDLIEYWNSLGLRQHKKPNTKTYQNIAKKFKRLKNGSFYKFYELDKSFLNKNKITSIKLKQKMTDSGIKAALSFLSLLFKEGYWPQNKDLMPKDLDSLIFNPRTGYSWFFKVLIDPPKPFSKTITAKPKNQEIYEKYKSLFNGHLKSAKMENNLILSVNSLIEEVNKIYDNVGELYNHTSFSSYLGTSRNPTRFFDQHISFLKTRKKLHPNFMGIDSFTWTNFITHLHDTHQYIIYPNTKQLKLLKMEYNQAQRRQS